MRPTPLNRRERAVLCIVESLHREYDLSPEDAAAKGYVEAAAPARFTRRTIERVAGAPCAGSLGNLAALGLLDRGNDECTEEGVTAVRPVFSLTDDGRRAAALVREQQRHGRITVPRSPDGPTAGEESTDGDDDS